MNLRHAWFNQKHVTTGNFTITQNMVKASPKFGFTSSANIQDLNRHTGHDFDAEEKMRKVLKEPGSGP